MSNLVEVIKRVALEAVNASQPTSLVVGMVVGTTPLQITIDQKLTLDEDFLILTNNVKDHYVDIKVSEADEKKKRFMYYGLKQGESVLLIKIQGGQKYIVLDRIGDVPTEGEWV